MANIGTQIHNKILKAQGFDYHEFESTNMYSTKTGLTFLARFDPYDSGYGRHTVTVNVDRNDNGTYDISFGRRDKTVVASNVAEAELSDTLTALLRKEKNSA